MDFSLIIDWLGAEGGHVLAWWLLVTGAGAGVWPLFYRVMGGLPDRGYALARAGGLMLTGFVFWFLASLGLLRNTPGSMLIAWLLVVGVGVFALLRWDERPPLRPWLRENAGLIIAVEVLFLVLLFGWAIFRAHNPDMNSTERPMEIMFLNSIRASETFPPQDGWMAGYAISYYYFGYVIMAMLADLSGVNSGIGFNLMGATVFALSGIGALGVVYDLVRARSSRWVGGSRAAAIGAGLLGAVMLVMMGHLGTALVEIPFNGYVSPLVDGDYFRFWDVPERTGFYTSTLEDGTTVEIPFDSDGDSVPNWDDDAVPLESWPTWWWFRYSRVVNDRDLSGESIGTQPIAEVPAFSFVLADMHPHVLALPFAVLALGLMLNLVLRGASLVRFEYVLYAILVGGMVFLNSWDAIYLPLLVGAEALRRLIQRGRGAFTQADVIGLVRFAAIVGGLTLLLYLPWLISFTSQAGGVLPNVIYPTQWQQFFLQFGIFLVILVVFLAVEARRAGGRFHAQAGLLGLAITLFALVVGIAVLGVAAWQNADVRNAVYSAVDPVLGLGDVLPDVFQARLEGLPSELLLLGMIFLVVGRLFAQPGRITSREDAGGGTVPDPDVGYSPATGFTLLLVGAGVVLTLAPDFVYLKDNFGLRMNTVFKLYYQGWILFSVAGAFAVWSVLAGPRRVDQVAAPGQPVIRPLSVGRIAFGMAVMVLVAAGAIYPLYAFQSRALGEGIPRISAARWTIQRQQAACDPASGVCPDMPPLTLDGRATMVPATELTAIECLDALEPDGSDAILAEAPGGAYQPSVSRFSGLTGIPTLIGWQNHERQWRGETYDEVIGKRLEDGQWRDRVSDMQDLYTTSDWDRAWGVLDRYGIDYIVLGEAERQMISELARGDAGLLAEYQRGLEKFELAFTPVCQAGDVTVYRVGTR